MKFRSKRSPLRSQKKNSAKVYNRSRGSRTGSRTFGLRFQVNRVNTQRRYARSPPHSKSKSKSLSNENENKNRQTHKEHILKEQPLFSPYSKYKLDFGNKRRHIQFKDDETLEQIRRFPSSNSNSLGRRMVKWGPAKTISYQAYKTQEDNKFKLQLIKQINSWREISEFRGNIAWPLLSTRMSLDSIETEYEKLRNKLLSQGENTIK